jgi:very-short-patch-repair endonuclease
MDHIERAREMRKAMTPAEIRLWLALRRLRADGFHFRRQVPFRGYFLDFVCHGYCLVIEVDGQTHDDRVDHDRLRDAVLAREGYRTLRFSNEDVRTIWRA